MFRAFASATRAARRAYSTAAPAGASANEFEAGRQAIADHAKHSAELWRKITCVLVLSLLLSQSIWSGWSGWRGRSGRGGTARGRRGREDSLAGAGVARASRQICSTAAA